MLRAAICHQIFNVGFLRKGSQPGPFASLVSKGKAYLHWEEYTKCKGSEFRFFQICTARLDAFGTNAQWV